MTRSALTLEQARQALARCAPAERALLADLDAHESALVLEAKVYADATLSDGWPSTDELAERRVSAARARQDFERMLERNRAKGVTG